MSLRTLPAAAGATALLLALSACGGSSSGSTSTSAESSSSPSGRPDAGVLPGASGTIAAVSGKTLQVQSPQNGQVAVSYTGKTAFSQQVSASLSDLKVGDCVMAASSAASGDASDTVAADSVRITPAVKGSCAMGGGRAGGPGAGPGGERPSGAPTDRPSGAPSGGPGGAGRPGGAFGTVTKVSSDGFTVKQSRPGSSDSAATTTTVTVTSKTTFSTTAKATAAAAKVGRCATAMGKTDDTGAVTASSISLSDPVDGECTAAFGRRPGGQVS
jgi:hypothetical protein